MALPRRSVTPRHRHGELHGHCHSTRCSQYGTVTRASRSRVAALPVIGTSRTVLCIVVSIYCKIFLRIFTISRSVMLCSNAIKAATRLFNPNHGSRSKHPSVVSFLLEPPLTRIKTQRSSGNNLPRCSTTLVHLAAPAPFATIATPQ